MIALRDAFIHQIIEEAAIDQSIVVIDCDVGKHTRLALFKEAYPKRFYQAGICEQNAISIAAGMSECGKFPIISSMACFIVERAFEQIKHSIIYNEQNVLILGTHAGLSAGEDGASHQCFEDVPIMLSLPEIAVFTPAFPSEISQIARYIVTHKTSAYIRVGRNSMKTDIDVDKLPCIGYPLILKTGNSGVVVLSCGEITQEVIDACKDLDVTCIHIGSFRPFHYAKLFPFFDNVQKVIVIEETTVAKSLTNIVVNSLYKNKSWCEIIELSIPSHFGETGTEAELRKKYHLDSNSICDLVGNELKKIGRRKK